MYPNQPPVEASPVLSNGGGPESLSFLRRFTGNYFTVLGWMGIALTVISVATVYWTDYLYIDLFFILWFWLGSSLKKGIPAARKWAIAIFVFVTAFGVLGLFVPGVKANLGGLEFERSHSAFFAIIGIGTLVFAIPGVMLLGERGRSAFTTNKKGQSGADQSASVPEEDLEGDSNLQPESTMRSR